MHTNGISNSYIIEATNVKYNPSDFLYLYDKYNLEMYIDKNSNPFGLEISADPNLLHEPIIQHYLNVFKDFVKIEYFANELGTGWQTYSLIRSKLERGLFIHKDNYRGASITFPITFPQSVNWHTDKNGSNTWTYDYKPTIVFCNVGAQWHGVSPSNEPRLQFQFDCSVAWEDIPSLLETL